MFFFRIALTILMTLVSFNSEAKSWLDSLCESVLNRSTLELPIDSQLGPIVIRGRPVAWNHFRYDPRVGPSSNYESVTKLIELFPESGPGRIIVIENSNTKQGRLTLWKMVLKYPHFFAQYEIYADAHRLAMPNAERMNFLNPNGPHFFDMPRWGRQHYNDLYFERNFLEDRIPLASRDAGDFDGFSHDRLEEHFFAALLVPNWLRQQAIQYARFQRAWRLHPAVAKNKNLRERLKFVSHPSAYWDRLTSGLGIQLRILSEAKEIECWHIKNVMIYLESSVYEFKLTPWTMVGGEGAKKSNFTPHLSRDEVALAIEITNRLRAPLQSPEVSPDQILDEAINIIHKLTNTPKETLKTIWQNQ